MKVGDKVTTPDGPGTVTEVWSAHNKQWVRVALKGSSFEGPYPASVVKLKVGSARKKHTPM